MSLWDSFTNAIAAAQKRGLEFTVTIFQRKFSWTGYTKSTDMKNVFKLIDVIATVYDTYTQPKYDNTKGVTYCNFAAQDIAENFGIHDFDGKLANEIVDLLQGSGDWSEVPLEKAQDMANQGTLIFATLKEQPHGHICVVRPGVIKTSGKWGNVPCVMNIGKLNFIGKGLSWAFAECPKLYAYRPTL